MHIRTLQEKDIAATEEICLKTAPASAVQSEKDKLYTLYMYNRYYTRAQKDACFVAADDKDRAVGYILCAPDYKKYLADFKAHELLDIRKLGFWYFLRASAEIRVQRRFQKNYPAHLHIDLLPEYQRRHLGSKLLDALKAYLKSEQIPGVYLCVGAKNTGAVAFYKAQGFKILANIGGSFAMGFRIETDK